MIFTNNISALYGFGFLVGWAPEGWAIQFNFSVIKSLSDWKLHVWTRKI